MSKSELSSVSPMGAKKNIQFVSRFHGFFRHWMERESRAWRLQTRYGPNEKKKVHGEVANGDFCPRKVEGLFCLLRLMKAAQRLLPRLATHGQQEGKRPWRGREPNRKLRSSSASIDVDVKKHEQGAAAHTPEVRSGRSRVGVGWVHIRYDTELQLPSKGDASPTEERLCGKFSHLLSFLRKIIK